MLGSGWTHWGRRESRRVDRTVLVLFHVAADLRLGLGVCACVRCSSRPRQVANAEHQIRLVKNPMLG
jgi:hypothetical protein